MPATPPDGTATTTSGRCRRRGGPRPSRWRSCLRRRAIAPDLFITSPKVRALETAEIVAEALKVEVVVDRRLAGPLDPDLVTDILLAAGPAERPCIVGHDPEFSELLGELVGTDTIPMRKGALARVDFVGPDVCRRPRDPPLPHPAGAAPGAVGGRLGDARRGSRRGADPAHSGARRHVSCRVHRQRMAWISGGPAQRPRAPGSARSAARSGAPRRPRARASSRRPATRTSRRSPAVAGRATRSPAAPGSR